MRIGVAICRYLALPAVLCFFTNAALADRMAIERGLEAYRDQKWDEALSHFQQALREEPDNPQLHFNIGTTQFRQTRFKEAVEAFEKALLTDDVALQQRAFYNKGNALAGQEQYQPAIEAYKKALELNPQDVDSKHNLELVRARLKEKSEKQEQQQDQQQEQPEPSEYARQLKAQAENLVLMRLYPEAHGIMAEGLKTDPTVEAYRQFIDRIKTIVDIGDTP